MQKRSLDFADVTNRSPGLFKRSFFFPGFTMASDSPLLSALAAHQVSASVVELDHYRIHGGWAVETDYIIEVKDTDGAFNTFR